MFIPVYTIDISPRPRPVSPPSRCPIFPAPYPDQNAGSKVWRPTPTCRTQTIRPSLPRSYLFLTVNHFLSDPRLSLTFIPSDEAFVAKNVPYLGYTVKESKVFHWKVQGWGNQEKKKLTSPEFSCGGCKWYVLPGYYRLHYWSINPPRRILLFPFGLPGTSHNETVSVYLNHARPEPNEGWYACGKFALVISNPHDPTIYTVASTYYNRSGRSQELRVTLTAAHHRFTAKDRDWGFTRFGHLDEFYQPQPGHDRPTIEEGSAVISVYMRIIEDPTGVLWHNFVE